MATEEFIFEVEGPARIDVTFTVHYEGDANEEEEPGTQLHISDVTVLGKIDQTVDIPVFLSEALDYDLYVPYVTVDADPTATATPDVDYETTSGSITIAAGDLDGTLTVDTFADGAGDPSTVTFVGITHFEENTANLLEAFPCDRPAGVQVGDFMLAVLQKQGNGSITAVPSGWTLLVDEKTATVTNAGCHLLVYYKVATSSEDNTYTWEVGTGVSGAMAILAYRGVDLGTTTWSSVNNDTAATDIPAPTVTTVNDDAVLVTVHAVNPNTGSGTANFTTPSGMTERYDSNLTSDGTTLRAGLGVFDNVIETAGATGTVTSTCGDNGRYVAFSIALEPVASQPVTSGTEFFFVQLGTPLVTDSGGAAADILVARAVAKITIVPDAEVDPEEPPISETGGGVMHGWHQRNEDVKTLRLHEGHLGKQFACVRMFANDKPDAQTFKYPSLQAQEIAEEGRLLLWSVKRPNWALTASSDAAETAWIDEVGRRLQSWDVPAVIFIFNHEPHENSDQKDEETDADSLSDEADGAAGRTAAGFIGTYARINSRWHDAGYLKRDGGDGKILIGYCAVDDWALGTNPKSKAAAGVDPLYPGSANVDVLCHDAYNEISGTPDKSFADLWLPVLELCEEQGKPLVIGETGSKPGSEFGTSLKTELGGSRDRDEWFEDAATFMETNELAREWLKGFCYYHSRRWMFLATDGTPHLGGYDGEVGPAVEGKDGWIAAFRDNPYFKALPFDPTSATPIVEPEVPSGCGNTYTATLGKQDDIVPSGNSEISGICASKAFPTTLWAVKDSPTNPDTGEYLIRMKTTGTVGEYDVNHIDITGSSNSDWEDCFYSAEEAGNFIYIFDNRDGNGKGIQAKKLYKVVEPSNPDTSTSTTIAQTYYWRFPADATTNICKQAVDPDDDAAAQALYVANNQNCEAVFMYPVNNGSAGGKIYAVQKGKGSAAVYLIGNPNASGSAGISTSSASPTTATLVGKIDHSCPSSFAINVAGDRAISVSHGRHRVWKGQAGTLASLLSGQAQKVLDVSGTQENEESADWFPHGSCAFQVIAESKAGWRYTNSA
jgi:hypothetical protein